MGCSVELSSGLTGCALLLNCLCVCLALRNINVGKTLMSASHGLCLLLVCSFFVDVFIDVPLSSARVELTVVYSAVHCSDPTHETEISVGLQQGHGHSSAV